ncbi:hypothetical protein RFI_31352, partial [Reticulomyxa filosa]
GVVGLRIDNVDGVFVDNVSIKYLNNWGEMGHYTCNNDSDPSHIVYSSRSTIPTNHYEATATRAISVINSKHVFFGDIHIHKIASSYGNAFGLHVFDNLTDFQFFDNFVVDGVAAASSFTHSDVLSVTRTPIPNYLPYSCAFALPSSSSSFYNASYLHSSNIYGHSTCPPF